MVFDPVERQHQVHFIDLKLLLARLGRPFLTFVDLLPIIEIRQRVCVEAAILEHSSRDQKFRLVDVSRVPEHRPPGREELSLKNVRTTNPRSRNNFAYRSFLPAPVYFPKYFPRIPLRAASKNLQRHRRKSVKCTCSNQLELEALDEIRLRAEFGKHGY